MVGSGSIISDLRLNEQIAYNFFFFWKRRRKCYIMYNKVKKSSDKSDILDFGSIYN